MENDNLLIMEKEDFSENQIKEKEDFQIMEIKAFPVHIRRPSAVGTYPSAKCSK